MKNARHEEILRIIREYAVETQEELAARLIESGFQVTQATVSRDIRQLRLRKTAGPDGRQRYTADEGEDPDRAMRYQRVLADAFVSLAVSGNILVIHTVSGMAMAAAAALDSLDWPELLGSIAGDDTIMAVIRSPGDAPDVVRRIEQLTQPGGRYGDQREPV